MGAAATPASKNIVQLAEGNKDLSILVAAITAADLADTLSSTSGKFTVFAPTDEAFKALPAGTLDDLMKPENKAKLVDILKYHVLPEEVESAALKPFQAVTTVEGKPLHVTKWGGKVRVGPSLESKDLKDVISADNQAVNGVVHIIDGVLLPPQPAPTPPSPAPASKTIVDLAVGTSDLSTLVTALKAANLVDTLSGKGPFTVFAPTNEAFAKLDKRVLDYLLEPCHVEELKKVLTYHVVSGVAAKSTDLKNGEEIKTVEGQEVKVTLAGSSVKINNADVTTADVEATNGVVHIIDHVLIPYRLQAEAMEAAAGQKNIVQLAEGN